MTIDEKLRLLTNFMPLAELKEKISLPVQLMPEPITTLIPSIILAGDGLALVRLVLVSESYICDVQMSAPEFDFVAKSSLVNYRFSIWNHEIKDGETVKATFQVAQIRLIHELSERFYTELSYAGDQRDAWLKEVLDALPVALILTGG